MFKSDEDLRLEEGGMEITITHDYSKNLWDYYVVELDHMGTCCYATLTLEQIEGALGAALEIAQKIPALY